MSSRSQRRAQRPAASWAGAWRKARRPLSALWRDSSGQAMAEYAIIVCALMGGLTVMSFEFIPQFIEALQRYLDNFYVMIKLPLP